MTNFELLNSIASPADVKKLDASQLEPLAAEMRQAVLQKVSAKGGHLGPNLGVVELTIALHRVFNSPQDKIVWDVSHQCYPHKLLTGRAFGFTDPARYHEISGYTAPAESEHDIFTVGHTSTSVSLACGLAKARDILGQKHNVIAVIGDGSLSGGEAFEGLDNAAELGSNFIVIINDNEMSIAENHGGIYSGLAKLRASGGTAQPNFFESMGFAYHYVENGNDIAALAAALQQVKDSSKPVVVHVHTLKGKGYQPAEENKEAFHWSLPFDIASGRILGDFSDAPQTYGEVLINRLEEKAAADSKIAVINAATPGALALQGFRSRRPGQYYDVGIAEQHAVAFASALAKGGAKPVALFYGGFIQRAYDQLSQDLCLNNSPAVMVIESAGISAMDCTHLSVFDIPLMSNIPNLVYLAPTCAEETKQMLDWALGQREYPVALRLPGGAVPALQNNPVAPLELNKFVPVKAGSKVAIFGLGGFFALAEQVADKLAEHGINATLINPRFITGLDEELLTHLIANHDTVVTLEDGVLDGGFGEKIARFYGDKPVKVYNFGAKKEFTDRVPVKELYRRYELTPEQITARVLV